MKLLKVCLISFCMLFAFLLIFLHYKYYRYLNISRVYWLSATILSFIDLTAVSILYLYLASFDKYKFKASLTGTVKDICLSSVVFLRKLTHTE